MGISIARWAALAPQISYWAASALFETLLYFGLLLQYRVIPKEEDAPKKNQVSKLTVVRYMVLNQTFTTILLFLVADYIPMKSYAELPTFETLFADSQNPVLRKWAAKLVHFAFLAARQFVAVVVMDSWQFWCHFTLHKVPWLYRNIHSVHHKLYVPYSYAALYNHWAESLVQDNIGGVLGVLVAGLTDWEQVFFYAWVMAKTVEDHSGYELPFSPFIILARWTGAGVTYHNIHHQTWGLKTNFQIYFTYWDRLMSTVYIGNRKLIEHRMTPGEVSASVETDKAPVVSGTDAATSPPSDSTSTTRHRLAKQNDSVKPHPAKNVLTSAPDNASRLAPDTNGNGNLMLEDLLGNGLGRKVTFDDK